MLVLFMLIGTAFLMSSSQYRTSSKAGAKLNRVGNYPTNLLDRGLMAVLRDTNNPNSAIRYHSLLRDMYGVDGFEGVVYSPASTVAFNATISASQVTRYADATVDVSATPVAEDLGPTQGQLIDIYVRALGLGLDDPLTPIVEGAGPPPDPRHVINLERNVNGIPQLHPLPLTKGYYNGCLMTITSGPARGQSTRIVDYEYIGTISPPNNPDGSTKLYRFRVMAFPRADGLPLQVDLNTTPPSHNPELSDLAGATFIVNGRPFNGTGVGYNPLADVGAPRLSALEAIGIVPTAMLYPEIALTPNACYFFTFDPRLNPPGPDDLGARYFNPTTGNYDPFNPTDTTALAIANRPSQWRYPTFAGPGDTDESYDAADFQNMALALQSVTPRARGRVVTTDGTYNVEDPAISGSFLRLDLEDLPLPSFHRPDLINYWYHRLIGSDFLSNLTADVQVQAILRPYADDGSPEWTLTPQQAGQITALKRKISLRPLREDHPHFDGSNPLSRPISVTQLQNVGNLILINGNIAIPYWEAVGPWDVDNDNDSVPDSNWVDLGDPVQQAEDGTLYKPLYAFLILDMDGRLNVNAHGLAEHIGPPAFDQYHVALAGPPPTAALPDLSRPSTDQLPHGLGYGPAEISLRPVFPAPWFDASGNTFEGNRLEDSEGDGIQETGIDDLPVDDYAALLAGRIKTGGTSGTGREIVTGRYGFDYDPTLTQDRGPFRYDAAAGVTSVNTSSGAFGAPDVAAIFKFIGYPNSLGDYEGPATYLGTTPVPSSFATPPDLTGRYSLGLDYTGQPAYEYTVDPSVIDTLATNPAATGDRPLVADSPYELDLSSERRRGMRADRMLMVYDPTVVPIGATVYVDAMGTLKYSIPSIVPSVPEADTDDAPFATAELERILRAHDPEAGAVPSRLWDLVAAFDPIKLLSFDPYRVQDAARTLFNDPTLSLADSNDEPQMLTAAQQMADINRRLVTTDSYDLPVPGGSLPHPEVLALGADGAPGRLGVNDDGNSLDDDISELNAVPSDDFQVIFGKPAEQGSLTDLLTFRVWKEMRKQVMSENTAWDTEDKLRMLAPAAYQTFLTAVSTRTLAVLNGEPFNDVNGNGIFEPNLGETYTEATGNGVYDPPLLPSLLAPELIAGQKMDLNRPFGDGRDNGDGLDNDVNNLFDEPGEVGDPFLNGIVDEPSEAGEPFLDIDGNGKWNSGEPFVDVLQDNSGGTTDAYDGPRDHLWQGMTAESIAFDYTNGRGEPIHPSVAGGAIPAGANVRNLNSQGRQLYARQLYILMMLLVDENYVETPDIPSLGGDNIDLEFFLAQVTAANPSFTSDEVLEIVLRKLTARRIAQWAVNCVDFRDADAIMTPFEYDDNPWDGWGCPDGNRVNIPLDGDVATNESVGEVIDWATMLSNNSSTKEILVVSAPGILDQTRGVVWGVERPELLITESLAFHDRRSTDESGPGTPPNRSILDPQSSTQPPDYDLDQRLKPRGSMFVELYNPWTPDGQKPAELYDKPAAAPADAEEGVMLDKLSDAGVSTATGTKYSPVWRVAVIRDPINGTLTNQIIDVGDPAAAAAVESTQLLSFDPDGFSINVDEHGERWIYFTSGDDPNREDDNTVLGAGAADYKLVGGGLVPDVDMPNRQVWIPPLPYRKESDPTSSLPAYLPTGRRYFIARQEREIGLVKNDTDVAIAPILPGRYAVVGSSGVQLDSTGKSTGDGSTSTRFVTTIGRLGGLPRTANQGGQQSDRDHWADQFLRVTRRFELWPNINPEVQQLLVGNNGGQEFVRMNGTYMNVTDGDLNGVPDIPTVAGEPIVEPSVAIPVEDMNISEPTEGYPSFHYKKLYYEKTGRPLDLNKLVLNRYGELEYDVAYDRPLDLEFSLVRNGTTQNYKSLHLQRLADPTMPWNPLPFLADGKTPATPNPLHQKNLPINPYRTIDSMSADLTAFNGASELERTELPTVAAQTNLTISRDPILQEDFFAPLTAGEYQTAQDHVLWGLAFILAPADPVNPSPLNEDITPKWLTVKEMRALPEDTLEGYLTDLEQKREGNVAERKEILTRTKIESITPPLLGRDYTGQWGWSLYRRVLPDDELTRSTPGSIDDFRQRLHMKTLERGGHYLKYFPNYYPYDPDDLTKRTTDEGWGADVGWVPRLLWQQERPNVTLFLRSLGSKTAVVSDLKNVKSRRLLEGTRVFPGDLSPDDARRSAFLRTAAGFTFTQHVLDHVVEHTLGFANEAYAPELDRTNNNNDNVALMSTQKPGAPEIVAENDPDPLANPDAKELDTWNTNPTQKFFDTGNPSNAHYDPAAERDRREQLTRSTYPWLTWNDRPFVSQGEIMQVPATSSSLMLHDYSVLNRLSPTPYNGVGLPATDPSAGPYRLAIQQSPFGHLLNFFMTKSEPAQVTGPSGGIELDGAPNYYRILDYVEVPSRYVGTETLLRPEVFNDVPGVDDSVNTVGIALGSDITGPADPRYALQPPYNKVSRQRDPGRVNLNTVVGRREVVGGNPRSWSEVYDGLMHRVRDGNLFNTTGSTLLQLSQFGPAWRDVTLSRRGYEQYIAKLDAFGDPISVDKSAPGAPPDTLTFGLNKDFPSFFSNPFRSPEAGNLVPLESLLQHGVDATWLRVSPRARGDDGRWGVANIDDDGNGLEDDAREAGFGDDLVSRRGGQATIPEEQFLDDDRDMIPLFSEVTTEPSIDAQRNPYMMYEPMSRLGNLVTSRSNVYAVWITVGYFEVEPAPDWNHTDEATRLAIRQKFGGDNTDTAPATIAARALYDRVYPEGYALAQELGSATGDVRRERGFYIIDRTRPVGFKPGEDLNVEDAILVRRRIE